VHNVAQWLDRYLDVVDHHHIDDVIDHHHDHVPVWRGVLRTRGTPLVRL
jgi:hypothetical protein